jgi:hypothetical protein
MNAPDTTATARDLRDGAKLPAIPPSEPAEIGRSPRSRGLLAARDGLGGRRELRPPAKVIYCPPIVPSGPAHRIDAAVVNVMKVPGRWTAIADYDSPSMTRLDGHPVSSNGGHWVVTSGTDPWLHIELFTQVDVVRRTLRRIKIDGQAVSVYHIPQNLPSHFAGHDVATWNWDGVGYYASVHGYANRARTLAIAQGLIALQHTCGMRETDQPPCDLVMLPAAAGT